MIMKLKEMRETSELELDEEEAEPTIGRNFKINFEIPNEYSENILITDSDFILSDRTSAVSGESIRTWSSYSGRDRGWEKWLRFPHQSHKFRGSTCAFW